MIAAAHLTPLPSQGEYLVITTPTGEKVRRCERVRRHRPTGQVFVITGADSYPLTHCRPLGWFPRPGLAVRVVAMPWSSLQGMEGMITRVYSIGTANDPLPLADVRVGRRIADCQLTWIKPL